MKKRFFLIFFLLLFLPLMGVETTPRISDREIVERLTRLEERQTSIEKRIEALRSEMIARFESVDKRFESVDKRFESVDKRFDSMEKRFDLIQWMFGIFITVSLVILGFVVKMQWQLQKKMVAVERNLETQKDEINFFKSLVEKLITPKGAP